MVLLRQLLCTYKAPSVRVIKSVMNNKMVCLNENEMYPRHISINCLCNL